MQHFKIYLFNAGSWFATIVSIQALKDTLQIIGFLGSIAVSLVSIWWILRKAEMAEQKRKDGE
jgi:hypothetical protein